MMGFSPRHQSDLNLQASLADQKLTPHNTKTFQKHWGDFSPLTLK
jgi:hypothetical protein